MKQSWLRRNLTLILGILTILSSIAALLGWTRESVASWAAGRAAIAVSAETISRMDKRVVVVSAKVDAMETRLTLDERHNDVVQTQLLTELPIIKEDLKSIKSDVRRLLDAVAPQHVPH